MLSISAMKHNGSSAFSVTATMDMNKRRSQALSSTNVCRPRIWFAFLILILILVIVLISTVAPRYQNFGRRFPYATSLHPLTGAPQYAQVKRYLLYYSEPRTLCIVLLISYTYARRSPRCRTEGPPRGIQTASGREIGSSAACARFSSPTSSSNTRSLHPANHCLTLKAGDAQYLAYGQLASGPT